MDLIELSKQKGFLSRDKLVEVNEGYYYLWMCELQKWLREKHRLDITAIPIIHNKEHIPSYFRTYKNSCTWMDCGQSDTFEQALEKGLIESLKLIK